MQERLDTAEDSEEDRLSSVGDSEEDESSSVGDSEEEESDARVREEVGEIVKAFLLLKQFRVKVKQLFNNVVRMSISTWS